MRSLAKQAEVLSNPRPFVAGLVLAILSYLLSRANYLLFHTLAEGFAMTVAVLIYVVGTRTYKFSKDDFLLFLGNAYLFVAVLDLFHTMTYQGMGIFPGYDSNAPTQLWIAGRYLDAVSLLAATFFIGRRFPRRAVFSVYAAVTALLIYLIMVVRIFPDAFITGQGLTPFKVASEYVICGILVVAIWHLHAKRAMIAQPMYRLMVAAMAVTIASELSFTLYSDVYGVMNLVGHLFKILAYYLVYLGIVLRGLDSPYLEVKRLNENLETRVAERTLELQQEVAVRIHAEAELEIQRARLSAVLEQLPAGAIIAEAPSGRILLVNHQMERILRGPVYPSTNVAEYSERTGFKPGGRPLSPEEWPLVRSISTGEVIVGEEIQIVRGDGSRGTLSISSAPIYDAQGHIIAAVVVDLDITERVKLEEQRDDYVRAISHDLRNPLTSIHGQAQLLVRRLDKAGLGNERLSAEAILMSARRMNEMIEELAEVARMEAGELRLNSVPVDLPALALDVSERVAGPQEAERIRVTARENLPMVKADPGRLERILANLLSNALKYSPADREVTVDISGEDDRVVTTVVDRGQGISPEELKQLFSRYYRTKSAQRARSGLGLGLYITRGLVEAHGGSIWVDSQEGEGSTFAFSLPVAGSGNGRKITAID